MSLFEERLVCPIQRIPLKDVSLNYHQRDHTRGQQRLDEVSVAFVVDDSKPHSRLIE